MWHASIDHIKDFVMGSLLVKFLDDFIWYIDDLYDCFILETAWFYFEVAFLGFVFVILC